MKINSFVVLLILVLLLISGCEIYQTVYPKKVPKENDSLKNLTVNSIEELKPYIEPEVFIQLNKTSKITVIVDLRDYSGIEIPYKGVPIYSDDPRRLEREKAIQKRNEYFNKVIDEILITLPPQHFNLTHRFSDGGFGGVVNKRGIEILSINPHVQNIYMDKPVKLYKDNTSYENCFVYKQFYGTLDPTKNKFIEGEIEVDFNNSIDKEKILDLIRYYNFTYSQSTIREFSFTINVPLGQEIYWGCQFEKHPYVVHVSLGFGGSTQQDEQKENTDLSYSLNIFYNPKFLPLNVVIGSKSKDLDVMIQFISNSKIFANSKLDSDIANISIGNHILIGGPCANKLVADLYKSDYDCSKVVGLKDGQGLVKIIKKPNSFIYIIAGQTQNDTLVTAQIVSKQELNLSGTEVIIDTASKNVIKKDDNKLDFSIDITEFDKKNKTWICWNGKQCEFVKSWGDSPATIIPYFKAINIQIYGIKKEKPGSPTALCGASAGDICILVDNISLGKLNLSNTYTK